MNSENRALSSIASSPKTTVAIAHSKSSDVHITLLVGASSFSRDLGQTAMAFSSGATTEVAEDGNARRRDLFSERMQC